MYERKKIYIHPERALITTNFLSVQFEFPGRVGMLLLYKDMGRRESVKIKNEIN